MHFVEAALAIEQVEDGKDARVFLLEEVIGKDEGRFWKYMNNVSPIPPQFADKKDEERAQFLAFTQHVQYFKMKKLAFVSDYQGKWLHQVISCSSNRLLIGMMLLGGNTLLSDPQIVTDRYLHSTNVMII